MKPAPFEYFAPTSVEETCALLSRFGSYAYDGGEGGAICAPPTITNAISDALGVKITEQPLPPTRILELMGAIMPDEDA